MIAGAGTGISEVLDSTLPDVVSMPTFTSNIYTPTGPQPVTTRVSNGVSGNGGYVGQFTIATGDIGRLLYNCGSWCGEGGLSQSKIPLLALSMTWDETISEAEPVVDTSRQLVHNVLALRIHRNSLLRLIQRSM